ncbi:ABC transporter substrate-binding protein [Pandoraea capi]|uniref:ABC transporter substrate-binding protein n=1 Tax=Pandoraea capi TaxID=2508286 RepID=A0ABY6W316_9BURK|nr:ABC transporter substrate-binding protein [Pandoraea capi]VVE20314.1 ABC transporter substrate-binding protein [Pandoraea capi]
MTRHFLCATRRVFSIACATALATLSLGVSGVASAAETTPLPAPKVDPALAAQVPKFYRDRGTLTAGVNPDVAPIKFVDADGNIVGFTPELLSAAAAVLDLKVRLAQSSFDALIPGLSANRFDVLLSLSDFTSRQKVVTFVDYLDMGLTVIALPSKAKTLQSLDDLCGMQLALPRGTATMEKASILSDKCQKAGKQPVTVATYPDSNMTLLSLSTGASQVAWVDSPIGYYNESKFPAKYKVVYYNAEAPYGIGFGVDEKSRQLANLIRQALLKLQKDGTYDLLLKKWGLTAKDAKPDFPINGGTR